MPLQEITSPGFHILFALFRIPVHFIEQVRVGQEGAKTAFCAENNFSSPILGMGEVRRIGIAEEASAQGNKLFVLFVLARRI